MTTFIDFQPSATSNFQFTPTLDGEQYTAIIRWNLFGERYYMKLTTLSGELVANVPLTGSPPNSDINLVTGYFQSSIVFRAANNQFEVNP